MKPLTVGKEIKWAPTGIAGRQRERFFYIGIAIVIVGVVFGGFARTYFLRPYFTTRALMPLLHLHGIVFTSWLVLYFTQTILVAAKRTDIHRRLGVAGAVLAVLMVLIGTITAIIRAQQGATPSEQIPPLVHLVVPLADMLVFAILIGAGFYFRRRPDVHKRLMLLATISILTAAIARLPFAFLKAGPPAFFGITDLFIAACFIYDITTRRRVHRATALGGLLIVASQPLRLMVGSTGAWSAFAAWLTGWVG
ncbi:MAG: hypothetical protein ACJ741_21500 [Pyrinomonadaceae bacterium]